MSETYVVIKNGYVVECVTVNSINDLVEIYTEHEIIKRVGEETIGWTYDGVSFTAPIGG